MPFFAVLLVEVHETFRLLTDEQYRGDLYLITTAESPYVHEWNNPQLVRGRWQTRRNSARSLEMFILLSERFPRSVDWILPGEGKCLRPASGCYSPWLVTGREEGSNGNRNQQNSLHDRTGQGGDWGGDVA